jgi:hypothetical protein
MFADLDRLLPAVPHDEVAVQWDVAVEFGLLEASFTGSGAQAFDVIIANLVRCAGQVPATSRRAALVLRGLRPSAFQAA